MSFDSLASLCGLTAAVPMGGGVALGLFLAGATGSVMHCAPMCGPFVLAQTADRMARLPAARLCEIQRVAGALLLPYHLGRITTYAGLGALAGFAGSALSQQPWLSRLSVILLLIAAVLFLGQALRRLVPALHALLPDKEVTPPSFVRPIARLTARMDRSTLAGGALLGLTLGFLPCGFLYAALTAASATGGPAAGALAMIAFGLGTVPALVAVGIAGQAAGRRCHQVTAWAAPMVMLLNAALLAGLALRAAV